jgi:hypothetical protein
VKAVLLQLPVQSHDYGYSLENIPLAAGYLREAARQRFGDGVEVAVCPPEIASLGGDAAILGWIRDQAPDVVGFSCYLWNVERSLGLCGRLHGPGGPRVVLGGPEISPDNGLLPGARFDAAVIGEGEGAFIDLLAAWSAGGDDLSSIPGLLLPRPEGIRATPPRRPLGSLDAIPSPYLGGSLARSYTGTVFLETVRGCVYRCSYCSYHKQFRKLRTFDLARTKAEVMWAVESGASEISFIDPCFAMRPGIGDLLAVLEEARRTRPVKISCELTAEDLDQGRVDELVRAGVRHVEIGLQSTNKRALDLCGRRFDEALFVRGVRMLLEADMHVTADVMVGLPGDTLADVMKTVDFLVQGGLYTTLNLYPVSVLPNTVLREQASRLGIVHQDRPPYYVTSTPNMKADDVRAAFAYAEEFTGESYFPVELPRTVGAPFRGKGLVSAVVLAPGRGDGPVDPGSIGQALAVEITDPAWLGKMGVIEGMLRPLLEANPSTLVSWIVPEEGFLPGKALPFLSSLSVRSPHPCDREYMSTHPRSCSSQLFIRTPLDMGDACTLLPTEGGRGLEVFLPAAAGPEEEGDVSRRLGKILGRGIRLSFHDLPVHEPHEADAFLGSVTLGI